MAVVDDLNNNHNNNKDGALTKAHLPHTTGTHTLAGHLATGARALVFVLRAC